MNSKPLSLGQLGEGSCAKAHKEWSSVFPTAALTDKPHFAGSSFSAAVLPSAPPLTPSSDGSGLFTSVSSVSRSCYVTVADLDSLNGLVA